MIQNNNRHSTVEKATEWESYRNLPRFNHPNMAVIHPSPVKKKKVAVEETPDMTISSAQANLNFRRYEPK
jgi:hypothetical protein